MDVTKLPAPNHGGKRGGLKATSGKSGGGRGGSAAAAFAQHSQSAAAGMQVCSARAVTPLHVTERLLLPAVVARPLSDMTRMHNKQPRCLDSRQSGSADQSLAGDWPS